MAIESFIGASGEPAAARARSMLTEHPNGHHQLAMSLRRLSGETVEVDASFSMVQWNGRGVGRIAFLETGQITPRARHAAGSANVLGFGSLRIDLRARLVMRAGRPIDLTTMEFNLLADATSRPLIAAAAHSN